MVWSLRKILDVGSSFYFCFFFWKNGWFYFCVRDYLNNKTKRRESGKNRQKNATQGSGIHFYEWGLQ